MGASDEKVVKQILEYLKDERYRQAILLDGDWGTGKTFFIKEILISCIQKELPEKKVYYISLYGVSSTDEIISELSTSMLEEKLCAFNKDNKDETKKIGKGIKFVSKIFSAGMQHFDIDTNNLPKLSELMELKEIIVIFDDLERCELEVNQILGLINNFVEHEEIKAIIVANQKEIGRASFSKDIVQKYQIAINDNIDLNEKGKNNVESGKYTKTQLLKRAQELFSEDIAYREVKEKLVGLTIYYKPNFPEVFVSIVDKYILTSEVKEYLKVNKQKIVNIFNEKKYHNIRTLIFSLIAFEKFYNIINSIEFNPSTYIENEIDKVLIYTINTAIQIKSGKLTYIWPNGVKSTMVNYYTKDISRSKILGYRFVDDYLLQCILDEKEIKETINELVNRTKEIDDLKERENTLKYDDLLYWWELEDEEIEETVSAIYKELQEQKYDPRYFKDIIICFIQIEENGFDCIDYEKTVEFMENKLKEAPENFERSCFEILSNDGELITKYNEITGPLFAILDNRKIEKKKSDNRFLCDHQCWNEEFENKCKDNRDTYILDNAFFSYIEPESFIAELKLAKVAEIYNFIEGIDSIYSFKNLNEFFKMDMSNILQIIEELKIEELSMHKKTREIVLKKLRSKLIEYLKLIVWPNSVDEDGRKIKIMALDVEPMEAE